MAKDKKFRYTKVASNPQGYYPQHAYETVALEPSDAQKAKLKFRDKLRKLLMTTLRGVFLVGVMSGVVSGLVASFLFVGVNGKAIAFWATAGNYMGNVCDRIHAVIQSLF
jgi:hypothetical protein